MRVLGLDIGGSNIRFSIIDHTRAICAAGAAKLPSSPNASELARSIAELALKFADDNLLLGVGIAITGVMRTDRTLATSNIPAFNGIDPISLFQTYFQVPVFADNDVRCALRGEVHLGAARSLTNAACITLGTGIGGALLLDGRIRRGPHNSAGEFGLAAIYSHSLSRIETLEYISRDQRPKVDGRPMRVSYRDEAVLGHLASAVLTLHRVVDLQRIIFGGLAVQYGREFLERISRTIGGTVGAELGFDCDLVAAELGIYAGAIGAACLVLEEVALLQKL